METPTQTIERLLAALEGLTLEEQELIRVGSHHAALEVQARERPLVEKIAELLLERGVSQALPAPLQTRAQVLLDSRRVAIEKISAQLTVAQSQLVQLDRARLKAHRVRPTYGRIAPSNTANSFAGRA